jgi:hypothetical protein
MIRIGHVMPNRVGLARCNCPTDARANRAICRPPARCCSVMECGIRLMDTPYYDCNVANRLIAETL